MERIIRGIAGFFILVSLLLAYFVDIKWVWFTVFVGVSLMQSAFTNFCPMIMILKKRDGKKGKGKVMGKVVDIKEDLCIGCGKCVELCPLKILYLDDNTNKCKVTDENRCDKLRGCERVCPTKAIKIN